MAWSVVQSRLLRIAGALLPLTLVAAERFVPQYDSYPPTYTGAQPIRPSYRLIVGDAADTAAIDEPQQRGARPSARLAQRGELPKAYRRSPYEERYDESPMAPRAVRDDSTSSPIRHQSRKFPAEAYEHRGAQISGEYTIRPVAETVTESDTPQAEGQLQPVEVLEGSGQSYWSTDANCQSCNVQGESICDPYYRCHTCDRAPCPCPTDEVLTYYRCNYYGHYPTFWRPWPDGFLKYRPQVKETMYDRFRKPEQGSLAPFDAGAGAAPPATGLEPPPLPTPTTPPQLLPNEDLPQPRQQPVLPPPRNRGSAPPPLLEENAPAPAAPGNNDQSFWRGSMNRVKGMLRIGTPEIAANYR